MPSVAAHSAVPLAAAPDETPRRPSECGSTRNRPGGFGNIGRGFGCAKPKPLEQFEKDFGVTPRHICVGLTVGRGVTKVPPAIDHLLG